MHEGIAAIWGIGTLLLVAYDIDLSIKTNALTMIGQANRLRVSSFLGV